MVCLECFNWPYALSLSEESVMLIIFKESGMLSSAIITSGSRRSVKVGADEVYISYV